jgi:uncharacterized membrane protein (DUF2068 family)
VDWSLLACGTSGHVTYAPDEADVREQLTTQTESGEAWRCLRCGTFVLGKAQASGPAAQAPSVRRDKEVRSAIILRIFAIERFVRGAAVAALAVVVWRFRYSQVSVEEAFQRERPVLHSLFEQLGINIDHSKLVGLIQHALTLSPATLQWLSLALAAYGVIELIEGTGLWLGRRWGEYFAMVATSLGLPYEIYELASRFTVFKLALFAVNLLLVLYLVLTRRLFGVRGGKEAYEARLRSESIMDAAIRDAAKDPDSPNAAPAPAGAPTSDNAPGSAGTPTPNAAPGSAAGTPKDVSAPARTPTPVPAPPSGPPAAKDGPGAAAPPGPAPPSGPPTAAEAPGNPTYHAFRDHNPGISPQE